MKTLAAYRRAASILLAGLLVSGCATTTKPTNQAVDRIDETVGYRAMSEARLASVGQNVVVLAFSGGGTRAAALSYGVMQELRDTSIRVGGNRVRLLDEVDTISSVSGGSFTAAYYGVFGEKLFETYEDDFLRQSVQSILINRLLSPAHWMKATFSGFDRTEIAVDVYDRLVFKGATFADIPQGERPFIEINATDLGAGLRFSFTQERFDLMCSNLSDFSIARAVTASSAVPIAFSTVVLENHANRCDITQTDEWRLLNSISTEDPAALERVDGLKSYRDAEGRPYIHLVDGGISDNLGLRASIERIDSIGDRVVEPGNQDPPLNILVILVNAETKPIRMIEGAAKKPSLSATVSAVTSAQISRYALSTRMELREKLTELQARADQYGWPTRVFYSEVSFDDVPDQQASRFLNNLPTTLELDGEQIDALTAAGRLLLRQEPEFIKFLERSQGELAEDAISEEELCKYFSRDC